MFTYSKLQYDIVTDCVEKEKKPNKPRKSPEKKKIKLIVSLDAIFENGGGLIGFVEREPR